MFLLKGLKVLSSLLEPSICTCSLVCVFVVDEFRDTMQLAAAVAAAVVVVLMVAAGTMATVRREESR